MKPSEISDLLAHLADQLVANTPPRRDTATPPGAEIKYWDRGTQHQKTLHVARVINCTGSETDCRRIDDSLIISLFVQGLARPDPLFLGLDVDAHGRLIDYKGIASSLLYAIGPPRKGSLWETTTVSEIRQQGIDLAQYLTSCLESSRRRSA